MNESSDVRRLYGDIIDLPHHQSSNRKKMSLYDRAAQFAPFAALSGYDAMVQEKARLTDTQFELSEEALELLNRQLNFLSEQTEHGKNTNISVTYFIPDQRKSGGHYDNAIGKVKAVDSVQQELILLPEGSQRDPIQIHFQQILHIRQPGEDKGEYPADDLFPVR